MNSDMYIPAKTKKSIAVYFSLVLSFLPACVEARRATLISQSTPVQGEVQSQGGLSGGTQNGEVRSDKSGARSDTSAGEALKMNSEKSGASSSGPLQGETSKSASGPLSPLHVGGASSARLQGGTSTNGPLHGHVTGSGTVLPAFKLRMSEAQLKEAVAQYASDLRQFYLHVTDYHANQVALKKADWRMHGE